MRTCSRLMLASDAVVWKAGQRWQSASSGVLLRLRQVVAGGGGGTYEVVVRSGKKWYEVVRNGSDARLGRRDVRSSHCEHLPLWQ